MNLADLGKMIISYGAPLLGTLIAGVPGNAIGQIVASAFGGDINDPDGLAKKIARDPDAKAKLEEIQSTQKVELQKLLVLSEQNRLQSENERMRIAFENTQDARKQNVAYRTIYPQILSTTVVAGFFACIYWIAAYTQDAADRDILYLLTGILGTAFGAVVNYWLGSSVDKNIQLSNIREIKK